MLWRAILAFLALPGMVAFAVPLWLAWSERARRGAALWHAAWLVVLAGASLLLWCVREFYVAGRGTLAPWAPPRSLVASGPYRLSRNPMYIGVIDVLLGYALAVAIAFHLRVLVSEEPWARRTFGADWEDYRARVPRWLPRLRKS